MRGIVIAATMLTCTATAGVARPMWEQSDGWLCTLEMHLKAQVGGSVETMPAGGKHYRMDFAADTVTSAFTDSVGRIVGRHYYEGDFGNHNVVAVRWGTSDYPTIIVEEDGEFWETVGSGHSDTDREVWIATYRCKPQP